MPALLNLLPQRKMQRPAGNDVSRFTNQARRDMWNFGCGYLRDRDRGSGQR
jgi:hypothetical protein